MDDCFGGLLVRDARPANGGPPIFVRMLSEAAQEAVTNDPGRYSYWSPEDDQTEAGEKTMFDGLGGILIRDARPAPGGPTIVPMYSVDAHTAVKADPGRYAYVSPNDPIEEKVMGNSANLYTGIPTPFGDNNQFVRVWDTRPEHGGAPEVLKKYSIDAREMIKNQPTRYRYASPGEAVPERTEPTDAEVAEHGRNRQIKDLQAELEKAEQTVGAIRTNIETQIRLLSQP